MSNETRVATHSTDVLELLLAAGIDFVTGVPDSDLGTFVTALEHSPHQERYVLATREDNAIALAVGAYLASRTPLVFMKSAGFGNSIDALTSLVTVYEIPLVLFISWSGYQGLDVPHHNVIGEPLVPILQALNISTVEVDLGDPPEAIVQGIHEALTRARALRHPVAVLGIPKGQRKG